MTGRDIAIKFLFRGRAIPARLAVPTRPFIGCKI